MQATTQVQESVDAVPLRGQGDESHSRRWIVRLLDGSPPETSPDPPPD